MPYKIKKKTPGECKLRDTPRPKEHGWPMRDVVPHDWTLFGYLPLTIVNDDKEFEVKETKGQMPEDLKACETRIRKAAQIEKKMQDNPLLMRRPNILEILDTLKTEEEAGEKRVPAVKTLEHAVESAEELASDLATANRVDSPASGYEDVPSV